MTPIETYNDLKIKRLMENISQRGMVGHYCKSTDELVECTMKLVEGAKVVSSGGSMTLQESGIKDMLLTMPGLEYLDRDAAPTQEEKNAIALEAFKSDVYFMSTNAITEDGILVNIDGLGNRVAALCFGPKKVVVIAGVNKITTTYDEAILRARTVAAPINSMRLNKNTPCVTTGRCANCQSPDSICSYIVTTRRSMIPDRIHVVLVDQSFGY